MSLWFSLVQLYTVMFCKHKGLSPILFFTCKSLQSKTLFINVELLIGWTAGCMEEGSSWGWWSTRPGRLFPWALRYKLGGQLFPYLNFWRIFCKVDCQQRGRRVELVRGTGGYICPCWLGRVRGWQGEGLRVAVPHPAVDRTVDGRNTVQLLVKEHPFQ